MKSSICSPRTIRKFFLVGAVLLSTCTLQSTIVFATCVLQKTNPSQTRFSIRLQNATLEEFVKQVEQKNRVQFHIRRRSTSEWTHHTGRPRPYY